MNADADKKRIYRDNNMDRDGSIWDLGFRIWDRGFEVTIDR
jgi:hypothetical protein